VIEKSTLQFLSNLRKNNNKLWFETNRKKYVAAKDNVLAFTSELIAGIAKFDKQIGELDAKKCTFRINRDVRFSANKAPYKTNMGAWMNVGGKKVWNAGYYFHCEPSKSFMALGLYQPTAEWLAKVRQEIDYNLADFEALLSDKKLKSIFGGLSDIAGAKLSRPPKGYEADNPAIEYLKNKSFVLSAPISDEALQDKKLLKTVLDGFYAGYPLNKFLNNALED
jgi:uncharacterized protein (TIGR02453 family)